MARIYRVGTRKSPLALKQVEEVLDLLKRFYPDIETEIIGIDSYGDKDRITPISEIEGSDFFTREIDEALLNGEVDFAIHSAKDLPNKLMDGLTTAAITDSIDPYDVLVSKSDLKLQELPYGAGIGTSSQRRKEALKRFRLDFRIVNIRGNIEERLALLDGDEQRATSESGAERSLPEGDEQRDLDAIVIAAAGLIRLGLAYRITQRIPFDILRPHPLQGALAVVTRAEDSQLIKLLSVIDSREVVLL